MAKNAAAWQVLPHGPLEPLSENLWRVQGTIPHMSLKRNMTLARMSDGALVIHSAVALSDASMKQIESFGTPSFLIVPNAQHRLDAAAYKHRYPRLRVYAPKGGREEIARLVPVDGSYETFPSDNTVELQMLHGVNDSEGVMLVRSSDGLSVILTDAVFNMDRKRDPLGWLITTLFGSVPGPRVSRLAKLIFVKDQRALREDLLRLAAMPDLVRLIVAHEKVASGSAAAAALRQAAGYLH